MEVQTRLMSLFASGDSFELECGKNLKHIRVAYETYGELNAAGNNAILICHALSGDAHAAGLGIYPAELLEAIPFYRSMKSGQPGWWDGAIGPGKAFDTNKYFVLCLNILGSCYGTTGPSSINPETGKIYGASFPPVIVRDMVKLQHACVQSLGINRLLAVSGGSLGGMQASEWALMYPEMVRSLIPVATSVQHSAWAVGFNHLARQAVCNDPVWNNGNYSRQPRNGLSLARQIGMISYRSSVSFQERFGRDRLQNNDNYFNDENLFQTAAYLKYQGKKLVDRFDANSFLTITRAIDLHDVAHGRGSLAEVLSGIKARTLCIGIDSDILYPAEEQKEIARQIPGAVYAEIKSRHGHDAFLIEFGQLHGIITPFLESVRKLEMEQTGYSK